MILNRRNNKILYNSFVEFSLIFFQILFTEQWFFAFQNTGEIFVFD